MTNYTKWRSLVDEFNYTDAIPNQTVLQPVSDDLTHFSGETGGFAINNNQPRIGELSLKGDPANSPKILSTSGLANYPAKGVSSSCLFQPSTDSTVGFPIVGFGAQDPNNFYYITLSAASGDFELVRYQSGSPSILDNQAVSITQDDFYLFYWDWHDGSESYPDNQIVVKLFGVNQSTGGVLDPNSPIATLSANDATFATETGIVIWDGISDTGATFEQYLTGGPLGEL